MGGPSDGVPMSELRQLVANLDMMGGVLEAQAREGRFFDRTRFNRSWNRTVDGFISHSGRASLYLPTGEAMETSETSETSDPPSHPKPDTSS